MITYSLQELGRLSNEFDLFERVHRYDLNLIRQGLYAPLPVSGNKLVWGFGLVQAAGEAGIGELVCIEVAAKGADELLKIALAMENRTGAYVWEERRRIWQFIKKKKREAKTDELVVLMEGRILPQWKEQVEEYGSFYEPLKRLVSGNLLDFKTASRIKTLPDMFFRFIADDGKRFSFSERRMLAEYLWETAMRDRLDEQGQKKLINEAMQKSDPLQYIRSLRFPELTALQARFAALTASLKKQGVTVNPPPSFEGQEYQFDFSCTSKAVFMRKVRMLEQFEDDIDRLFGLL